jgi:hypothetical protein
VRSTFNSDIPFSPNQADVWSGRGWSTGVLAGASFRRGPMALTIAPEWTYAQNHDFGIVESPHDDRSEFAPPWQRDTLSLDLPLRFGDQPINQVTPGQTSLTLTMAGVSLGASTESRWWGPGLRNAIVLSNNAPGFVHVFLRSDRPLATRFGALEGIWLSGTLRESGYFSTVRDERLRALSAAAVTLRMAAEPGLTFGVARSVYSEVDEATDALGRSGAVFLDWSGADELDRSNRRDPSEQITSLFARWIFPDDHAEIYAEWARHRLPLSIRDFLAQPNHTQGYTLGFQWARTLRQERRLRIQSEFTYLEQSATFRLRPTGSYYTSLEVPQGYTHRGRVVGASIGPGASSQWLAADLLDPGSSSVGVFVGRIRWNNDAYYTRTTPWPELGHDVTVLGGIRGRAGWRGMGISSEYTAGKRHNFLYQNWAKSWERSAVDAVDVFNHTLRFTVSVAERL